MECVVRREGTCESCERMADMRVSDGLLLFRVFTAVC